MPARKLVIEIAQRQSQPLADEDRLIQGVRRVLQLAGIRRGEISVAIVDDAEIHEINRSFLQHDYPTDVISFVLDHEGDALEGEIVASYQYAAAEAEQYQWPVENELLLYVVHGALHLVGHDDTTPDAADAMRAAERDILATFDLVPPGRE